MRKESHFIKISELNKREIMISQLNLVTDFESEWRRQETESEPYDNYNDKFLSIPRCTDGQVFEMENHYNTLYQ